MIKPPLVVICVLGFVALPPLKAGAQSLAEGTTRRDPNFQIAREAIAEGDKQYAQKHYDAALVQYQLACDHLIESPLTHKLRGEALNGFGRASVRLAEQRIAEGRYENAKTAAKTVLDPKYNPTYKPAIELLVHLDEDEHMIMPQVHTVAQLLKEAKGFYDAGRFDLAYKRYDEVLNLDPNNVAARKGQEDVIAAKKKYAFESYTSTALLGWHAGSSQSPPLKYINGKVVTTETTGNTKETEYIQNKLNRIIIPQLKTKDAALSDVINFLHKKSIELDTSETEPARKGVNIVLKLGPPSAASDAAAPAANAPSSDIKITLSLTNIPLAEALRYVSELAGLKIKVEPDQVTLVPLSEPADAPVVK